MQRVSSTDVVCAIRLLCDSDFGIRFHNLVCSGSLLDLLQKRRLLMNFYFSLVAQLVLVVTLT